MILVLGFHILCYVSYVRRLGRHNIRADRQEIELLNNLSARKSNLRLYKNPIVEKPILPDKKYEDMNLRNILMHEITHMKRYDIFVKWLLIFVGAIHWFNPLVYFVRREMNKACELACDESVIKRFDMIEMPLCRLFFYVRPAGQVSLTAFLYIDTVDSLHFLGDSDRLLLCYDKKVYNQLKNED